MVPRRSASVQRGSEFRARKPLASTSPRAEFCSSWVTTSGVGTDTRDTASASSSSRGGAILAFLRLRKRSKMSARARMEQATRGQIGQPAACMIENKRGSSAPFVLTKGAIAAPLLRRIIAELETVGLFAVVVGRHSQKLWITLLRTDPPPRPNPRQCFNVTER